MDFNGLVAGKIHGILMDLNGDFNGFSGILMDLMGF